MQISVLSVTPVVNQALEELGTTEDAEDTEKTLSGRISP